MSQELVRTNTIAIDVYKSPTASMLSICGKAIGVLNGSVVKKDNIMSVLKAVMEAVETVQLTEKSDKKTLAIDCLHWIVNNQSSMGDVDRAFLNNFIELTAGAAIDMIIAASKGLTELNKNGSCCWCF